MIVPGLARAAAGLLLGACELAAQHAFVEASTASAEFWVQQPLTLVVRIGFDRAFFGEHAIPLFRRETDLPVLLDLAPAPDPAILRPRPGTTTPGDLTLAWDDDVVRARRIADRDIGGRTFTVLEVTRTWVPLAAAKLTLPAPRLRYAHTSRFEDDFLNGRVAVDRKDEEVRGAPLTVTIRALPEGGRPPEFTGAVGTFTIAAEFSPRSLAVGEIGKLVLRVQGTGNLDSAEPPRLDALRGFHVYGNLSESVPEGRTWTFEIAPLREVLVEIPRLRFGFFDPGPPAGFRVVQTQPLPIAVRPLPGGKRLDLPPEALRDGPVAGVDDIHDLVPIVPGTGGESEPTLSRGTLVLGLCLPWLLAAFAFAGTRLVAAQRRRDPAVAAAFATLERGLAAPDANALDGFATFLGTHLGCPTAVIVTQDLAPRLEARGMGPELRARATSHLGALVAARFAGPGGTTDRETTLELARALHGHFMERGS